MGRICELSDDLLVKILSFLPTKVAVSTSILSKQWEFLWMWLTKLEYVVTGTMSKWLRYEEFIDKNLPLHRAPVIESFLLVFNCRGLPNPEKIKLWVGIVVSRFLRELTIGYFRDNNLFFLYGKEDNVNVLSLPISLYTCVSLMTLKLNGNNILVDVPQNACLPSLKTLELKRVTYSNEDSLRLLLSHCTVLEDLFIERNHESDNVKALVVIVPSLLRLSLEIGRGCSSINYVIVTPSLKYFKMVDDRVFPTYLIKPMTKLEEADIEVWKDVEKILESITSVRRLRLRASFNSAEESVYRAGFVFNQLEHLKLHIYSDYWSKLLMWLLGNSPKLSVLILYVHWRQICVEYEPVDWENKQSSVPECLLRSLETFECSGYMGNQEEKDFLSFFFKHACVLKSINNQSP